MVRNKLAVALAMVGGVLLIVGDFSSGTGLAFVLYSYILPASGSPANLAVVAILAFLAFTTSFAALFCFAAAPYISNNYLRRARVLLGTGIGLSALGLVGRSAYYALTEANPLGYIVALTSTLTGIGLISGFVAKLLVGKRFLSFRRGIAQARRP